jgi:signal transduction histidine kinase
MNEQGGILMPGELNTFDERVRREFSQPIKRQVARSSEWFIRLRWGAASGIALAGLIAPYLGYPPVWRWLLGVAAALGLVNSLFYYQHIRFSRVGEVKGSRLRAFNLVQIGIDWLAVLLLIHLTGGVSSPCIFFFFFHLVIAAILLPARMVYGLAAMSVLLFSTVFYPDSPVDRPHSVEIVAGFALSAFILVLVTSYVSNLMRQRMHQLSETKIRLEDTNARLEAILRVIRVIGEHRALDDLLAHALEQAAGLWDIRSGFVLLKDSKRETCFFAATHGLETPAPEASKLLDLPDIRKALETQNSLIVENVRRLSDFADSPSLQWLDVLGKRSLLLVPLQVGDETFGAIGLTSPLPSRFTSEDADYFRLFSDLIAIDIQNVQIQQHLQEYARTRTWFYRRAAHDLRAPLSAVRTMLGAVRDNYLDDPLQLAVLMGKADGRLEELQELVDELLLLAEDRVDNLGAALEPTDLGRILDTCVETFRPEAESRHITFTFTRPEPSLRVKATSDGLRRILANLVSNAVKYNVDGGEVVISVSESNPVTVSIADTGIGIQEEALPHVFQEFYRAPNAKSHTSKGTGLGLAIVRQLMESFGGRVRVEANKERGAVFILSFLRAE